MMIAWSTFSQRSGVDAAVLSLWLFSSRSFAIVLDAGATRAGSTYAVACHIHLRCRASFSRGAAAVSLRANDLQRD